MAPNAQGIAEELGSEEKAAIQDYWIRDSIYARRLLPWYPYQVGTSTVFTGPEKVSSTMSATELEERDVHEFVIISARYWPLFCMEELYRYVSRKVDQTTYLMPSLNHLSSAHTAQPRPSNSFMQTVKLRLIQE